ncbi:hypothetical protein WCX49_11665 [Sulfurimonas sp. HSL-1656]|uniref:hypothetical protein n=1 Tax=Thiomicrolovo subterrani TaxID=3131934 RepID=UPI0031F854AC
MDSFMKISLLVNTCDAFEDCWDPFFALFKKYWPDFDGVIYLNTETKSYAYPGLDIVPLRVAGIKNLGPFGLTWSECLIDALGLIDDDVILYMQEDYFLRDYVKSDLVMKYLRLIKEDGGIGCIHLTDQGTPPDVTREKKHELYPGDIAHRDLLSCQAAFWKKEVLVKCLKPSESGWQFEEYGSKRARYLDLGIYTPDRSYIRKDVFELLPYVFTGIVQGRWKREVTTLFEANGIRMDFSKRGFIDEAKPLTVFERIVRKIKRFPTRVVNYKDVFTLRLFKR